VTASYSLIIEKKTNSSASTLSSIIYWGFKLIYVKFNWTFIVPIIVWIVMVISWIFLMIKAYQGKMFKVPLIGNWAEKLANGKSATSNP
jgi:uncharacterized membrane protein